ncbi:hypothetical protein Acr_24g0008890 [Actinidia rufa]|uniref:Uncharacterized protein n=1 Tax=Actinidia rufa TaxID=165716 RepID=A0A7J0GV29_9ERIC|nr:hypothetical protein Acr_24g0008890 [Actinidia rufa]
MVSMWGILGEETRMAVWFTVIVVLAIVVFLGCVWMSLTELEKVLAIYVSKVLSSFVGGSDDKDKLHCDYYRQPRHTRETCWRLHGGPTRGQGGHSSSAGGRGDSFRAHHSKVLERPPSGSKSMALSTTEIELLHSVMSRLDTSVDASSSFAYLGVADPLKNRESALLPQKRNGNAPQSCQSDTNSRKNMKTEPTIRAFVLGRKSGVAVIELLLRLASRSRSFIVSIPFLSYIFL